MAKSAKTAPPSLEERIRQRAYALWQNAGEPHGDSDAHWHQARNEIDAESAALDGELADSFPASDPPSMTDPSAGTRAVDPTPEAATPKPAAKPAAAKKAAAPKPAAAKPTATVAAKPTAPKPAADKPAKAPAKPRKA